MRGTKTTLFFLEQVIKPATLTLAGRTDALMRASLNLSTDRNEQGAQDWL